MIIGERVLVVGDKIWQVVVVVRRDWWRRAVLPRESQRGPLTFAVVLGTEPHLLRGHHLAVGASGVLSACAARRRRLVAVVRRWLGGR